MKIKSYWKGFISILFPPLCVSCENVLLHQEDFICTSCRFHLPVNDHHLFKENELTKRLLGKAAIDAGAAYLSFAKSSLVQVMIHKLKYKEDYRVGIYLGQDFGQQLKQSSLYRDIDVVVPMPLHRKKQRSRGYNQTDYIARGIAETMSLPINNTDFRRVVDTDTQTKKSRMERYENVEHVFVCAKPAAFAGKHILLVDDVLTTGATMASAVRTLQESAGCRVSVAVLALA